MKKLFAMLLAAAALCGCSSNSVDEPETDTSSIYGVVVDGESGEPLRTVSVQLHKKGRQLSENKYEYNLLTSTVTFDDGHFEFKDLKPDDYRLSIVSTKYMDVNYNLTVEYDRQSSVDIAMLSSENATNEWVQIEDMLVLLEDTGNSMSVFDAMAVADGFTVKGEKGWRLPTRAELAIIYKYRASLNILDDCYWSSEHSQYYYYMNMSTGQFGTSYYSERVRFVKTRNLGSVKTVGTTNITETSATLKGTITDNGDPKFTERGFVLSQSIASPSISDPEDKVLRFPVSGDEANYTFSVSGLDDNTTYYFRAYITSPIGTSYGETFSFTTKEILPDYYVIDNLMVQSSDLGSATWTDANSMCSNSIVGGFKDWRLPTKDEAFLIYNNSAKLNLHKGNNDRYWTSTTRTINAYGGPIKYYTYFDMYWGRSYETDYTSSALYVRAVRTINE